MPLFKIVFEIPIYRCSPRKNALEIEHGVNQGIRNLSEEFPDFDLLTTGEQKETIDQWKTSIYSRIPSWLYNEIVGFLQIQVGLNQIRGELWFIDAKRIHKHVNQKKKTFKYWGKQIEIPILTHDTNESILNQLTDRLNELNKKRPFKGRYIYLESFSNIGEYIDWLAISKSVT